MLYAVIPLQASEAQIEEIQRKIEAFSRLTLITETYEETLPDVLFVAYDGNIRDLSKILQFGDDEKVGTGLVLQVTQYHGFAPKSLWAWMDRSDS